MNHKVACLCPTYCRPIDQLANVIACFEYQDYPNRELIILDDANQHPHQFGDRWKIISIPQRFRTLGEKRNAIAGLISPDTEILATWDSDDSYLPHHLTAMVQALESSGHYHTYSIPSQVYHSTGIRRGLMRNVRVTPVPNTKQLMYHGGWGFYRKLFLEAHGYPFMQSGQDQYLRIRFEALNATKVDPLQFDPRPSYLYSWFHRKDSFHVSADGGERAHLYEAFADLPKPFLGPVTPKLEQDWLSLIPK